MSGGQEKKNGLFEKLATFIVDKRTFFFLLYVRRWMLMNLL